MALYPTHTPAELVTGVLLTTTAVNLYTVPAGTRAVVTLIHAVNTSATDYTFTVYIGPTASTQYTVVPNALASAEQVTPYSTKIVMAAGQKLWAKASIDNLVALRVEGVTIA